MNLIPKNWENFQHYRDRNPLWIKLHKNLLDDRKFQSLPVAARALAPMLWLIASESTEGIFNGDISDLAFRLRDTEKNIAVSLDTLIKAGFFLVVQPASTLLAEPEPGDSPEKRREREEKRIEEEKRRGEAPIGFQLPDWINSDHWKVWHQCKKRRSVTDGQKQLSVDKLAGWRSQGLDFAGALEDAAVGGYQGLFLPDKPRINPSGETAYQRSMRERMNEFAPGIARRLPGQEFTDLEATNVIASASN
jgi:hypothetical protein